MEIKIKDIFYDHEADNIASFCGVPTPRAKELRLAITEAVKVQTDLKVYKPSIITAFVLDVLSSRKQTAVVNLQELMYILILTSGEIREIGYRMIVPEELEEPIFEIVHMLKSLRRGAEGKPITIHLAGKTPDTSFEDVLRALLDDLSDDDDED